MPTTPHEVMPLKVVVVSTQRHMLAAAEYSGRPDCFLLTAPAAAGYVGPTALKALVDLAPGLPAIIDCDDDPGIALRALACGWHYILISGPHSAAVKSAASSCGAVVFSGDEIGPHLRLALDRAPEPALGDYLNS